MFCYVAKQRNKAYFKKIGQRIKKLRMERGLTAREVTADVGLNIGRIENAGDDIRLGSILKLCDYFEITVQEFFKDI